MTLTANVSGLSDEDGLGDLSYQWYKGSTALSGETSNQYTLTQADVGGLMKVVVSYIDDFGHAESVTSRVTGAVVDVDDAPTGGVSITGDAIEGSLLTADASTLDDIDGVGSLSYQWYRDDTSAISDATASTYRLGDLDVGEAIKVAVTYGNGSTFSDHTIESSATTAIENINDVPTGMPSITSGGTSVTLADAIVRGGDTLTVAVGTLADKDNVSATNATGAIQASDVTFTWLRNGTVILDSSGDPVTSSNYVLTDDDTDALIAVRAAYTDANGTDEVVVSESTPRVLSQYVQVGGLPRQNQTLSANTLGLTDNASNISAYQWLRDGVDISGATSATFDLTQADVGTAISVRVTYNSTDYTSGSSIAVANVNDEATGTPLITGTLTQGETLAASVGTVGDIDGLPTEFNYQWLRNGVDIEGATESTYSLLQADVGSLISVDLSFIDNLGGEESRRAADTTAIVDGNIESTGALSGTGRARVGLTVTVDASDIQDDDGLGTFSYAWSIAGTVLPSTNSSLLLLGDLRGEELTVAVTHTDIEGDTTVFNYSFGEVTAPSVISAPVVSLAPVIAPVILSPIAQTTAISTLVTEAAFGAVNAPASTSPSAPSTDKADTKVTLGFNKVMAALSTPAVSTKAAFSAFTPKAPTTFAAKPPAPIVTPTAPVAAQPKAPVITPTAPTAVAPVAPVVQAKPVTPAAAPTIATPVAPVVKPAPTVVKEAAVPPPVAAQPAPVAQQVDTAKETAPAPVAPVDAAPVPVAPAKEAAPVAETAPVTEAPKELAPPPEAAPVDNTQEVKPIDNAAPVETNDNQLAPEAAAEPNAPVEAAAPQAKEAPAEAEQAVVEGEAVIEEEQLTEGEQKNANGEVNPEAEGNNDGKQPTEGEGAPAEKEAAPAAEGEVPQEGDQPADEKNAAIIETSLANAAAAAGFVFMQKRKKNETIH